MQATIRTTNGFGFDRIKVTLVAAGMLATAIAGTAAVQLANDTTGDSVTHNSPGAYAPQPAWRIAEMNALPVASAAQVTYADLRFAEMNLLPAAAVEATTSARIWFAEANTLPDATVATPADRDDYRFAEINQLPGDALVAPEMTSGTPS